MSDNNQTIYLAGTTHAELLELTAALKVPSFRAKQLGQWIYEKHEINPEKMLNLPLELRQKLIAVTGSPRSRVVECVASPDGTEKLLIELDDGETIEMVRIPSPDRMTFCLSTQVGCPVRCRFCASGRDGLVRNLRRFEMIEELLLGCARQEGKLPDNIVFMGIGEGLLNFDNLRAVLECLTSPEGFGMSPRRITVSTSGYVPGMRELTAMRREFTLAVSLHAVDDAVRGQLIPDFCRYPIAEILAAADEYREQCGRMVTLEYTLIDGINDSLDMADKLADLAHRHHTKINLIACNPVDGEFRRPGEARINAFFHRLEQRDAAVTLRVEKGTAGSSACGQLRIRRRDEKKARHK